MRLVSREIEAGVGTDRLRFEPASLRVPCASRLSLDELFRLPLQLLGLTTGGADVAVKGLGDERRSVLQPDFQELARPQAPDEAVEQRSHQPRPRQRSPQ